MARKRKTRASQAPEEPEPEPEPVQSNEPEEQPDQTLEGEEEPQEEQEPGVGEEEEEEEEEEEPQEEQEQGVEEEEEGDEDEDEDEEEEEENDDNQAVSEKNGSENNGEAEDDDDDDEDDEPLEKLLEPFSKDQLTLLIKEAVSKHPDVAEIVHKLADADPAHRKIFVHGLGWEANTDTITSVFGKYGEIEDCKVVKDKNTGKSKGYGFILFKRRTGARKALKQPQKVIEGRTTSCQLASAGPVSSQAAAPAVGTVASGPPVSEYTQRKIYVSNVSAELDPKKLLDFFGKFGEIEEGPLGLDKQTGKPRGFCLFVYKSVESARKALEEPHKNFEGQILHCQKAVDGPKHSKGFFNQPHQQPQQQQQGGYYQHPAKKGRYSAGGSGGGGGAHTGGHLMAPSAGPTVPSVGFNPAVAPAALGQAVAALLASQGAGLGIGNLLGMNPQGVPPMMNNAGYVPQGGAVGYGGQPGMQGGYGGQPPMGQGGVRPHQGGAPYMGRGH